MSQDLSAKLATTIVIEMMGNTNIGDLFARSQRTLQAYLDYRLTSTLKLQEVS